MAAFAELMLAARERARRAGTRPRTDHTIETALAIVRDLAMFLAAERGKQDWALADVHDIEAFLATLPRAAQTAADRAAAVLPLRPQPRRSCWSTPTRGLTATRAQGLHRPDPHPRPAARPVPPLDHRPGAHPHEALLGHPRPAARRLQQRGPPPAAPPTSTPATRTIRLGKRPHPVPLDPASWQVLQRCLAHRESQRTGNPHVIVTKGTKAGRAPASAAYLSHVLDSCGVPPRMLRCTRLADLVNTMDPKLVAAAFGMNPEGVMIYLADGVDPARLSGIP